MNNKKSRGKSAPRAGKNTSSAQSSPMDVGLLERIVKLMAANDLNTVDVRDGDQRVILKRGSVVVAPSASSGFYPPLQQGGVVSNPALTSGATASAQSAGTPGAIDEESNLVPIKSPMVGTFYAAPSPDAKPFVSVGSRVDEESDVCVVEAMKVFNNIKAETRGTIARILVDNGETVEFGQVLFLVKP